MAEYIERNKILNLLEQNDKVYHYADRDKENIVNDTVQTLCRVVIEAEATDVQPVKRGRWIGVYEYCEKHGFHPSGLATYYWCSECDKAEKKTSDFCPNCGADLREGL